MVYVPDYPPESVAPVVAGVAMLLLAGWLLYLNFDNRLHRAFAIFLFLRAMVNIIPVPQAEAYDATTFWAQVYPYFAIAVPFAALSLAIVYRQHYGGARRIRWEPLALLGSAVLLELLYVANHAFWATPGDFGPLFLLHSLRFLIYSFIALLFGLDFARAEAGPRRRALLLAAMGFALDPFFIGLTRIGLLIADSPAGFGAADDTYGLLATLLAGLAVIPVLLLTGVIVRAVRLGGTAQAGVTARFLALLGLAALSAIFTVGVALVSERAFHVAFSILDGFWTLLQPLFIGYAIVRHQLFDIDLKIRWTVRQSTLAAIFVAVYFVVSETTAEFLQGTTNTYFGIAAAGLLVFALAPLQRFAERISVVAMPATRPVSALDWKGRIALYREQARVAWADGRLDRTEHDLLVNLRDQLGLGADEADRIESEVNRSRGGAHESADVPVARKPREAS